MNYKKLLIKYIEHVDLREGTSFLRDHDRGVNPGWDTIFTDEEWNELQVLMHEDYKDMSDERTDSN